MAAPSLFNIVDSEHVASDRSRNMDARGDIFHGDLAVRIRIVQSNTSRIGLHISFVYGRRQPELFRSQSSTMCAMAGGVAVRFQHGCERLLWTISKTKQNSCVKREKESETGKPQIRHNKLMLQHHQMPLPFLIPHQPLQSCTQHIQRVARVHLHRSNVPIQHSPEMMHTSSASVGNLVDVRNEHAAYHSRRSIK